MRATFPVSVKKGTRGGVRQERRVLISLLIHFQSKQMKANYLNDYNIDSKGTHAYI